jgi:hypothetical protein
VLTESFSLKKDQLVTIEFHGLSQEPSRLYRGKHQGKTEPSTEEINAILSRGGPVLKDIHRDILELIVRMRAAAILGNEFPRLIDLQQSTLEGITKTYFSYSPGIQFVPASGIFAMADASKVRATRSSFSK